MRAIEELKEQGSYLSTSDENYILHLCAMSLAEHMGISRKMFMDLMKASKLYNMHTTYAIAATFYELMDEESKDANL